MCFSSLAIKTLLLLAVSTIAVTAQQKPKEALSAEAKKCAPKITKKVTSGVKPPPFQLRKGEKSTGYSPLITYEILESGEVSNTKLKRSSGISDIDNAALDSVKRMKYNRRPGCGTVDSEATVTVDLDAGRP